MNLLYSIEQKIRRNLSKLIICLFKNKLFSNRFLIKEK